MKMHLIKPWLIVIIFINNISLILANEQDSLLLIELHQKKFDYMIDVDLDLLTPLLHPELRYIHSNGWIENKEEVLENLESGYLSYNELKYKNVELRFYGGTAIITGLAEFNVALEGRQIILDLLYSETWYKTDRGWKLVHRHACRPLE